MGQAWQPWIQWGAPSKPVSDYQKIYDTCDQFSEKEIRTVKKHPLWKNMNILNQAMAKTSTSFISHSAGIRKANQESRLGNKHGNSWSTPQRGKRSVQNKGSSPYRTAQPSNNKQQRGNTTSPRVTKFNQNNSNADLLKSGLQQNNSSLPEIRAQTLTMKPGRAAGGAGSLSQPRI